jgi:LPXTG-site transpeptidase (sortase) family protein
MSETNTSPARAEQPRSRSPWAITIGVLAGIAVLLVAFISFRTLGTSSPKPVSSPGLTIPVPSQTAVTPSPSASPTIGNVPASAPLSVEIPSLSINASAKLWTEEMAKNAVGYKGESCYSKTEKRIVCVDPPTFTDAYYEEKGEGGTLLGALPGSDATANVYITGHASATQNGVFTYLYQLSQNDQVIVNTKNGKLTYSVDRMVIVDKDDYSQVPEVNEQKAGRLILTTCNHSADATYKGSSSTQNVVVIAHLVAAQPA